MRLFQACALTAGLCTSALGFAASQVTPFNDSLVIHLQNFPVTPYVTYSGFNGLNVSEQEAPNPQFVALFLQSNNAIEDGYATITIQLDSMRQCVFAIADGPWDYAHYTSAPVCNGGLSAGDIEQTGENQYAIYLNYSGSQPK